MLLIYKSFTPKEIIEKVAGFYNIETSELYKKSRRSNIVKPRQIAMYILREVSDLSYPLIGDKFGGKDHTTVIHSVEKIKKDILNDSVLKQEIEDIKELCS